MDEEQREGPVPNGDNAETAGDPSSEEAQPKEQQAEPQTHEQPDQTEEPDQTEGPAPELEAQDDSEEAPPRRRRAQDRGKQSEEVPGAHLEPDLVLETELDYTEYDEDYDPFAEQLEPSESEGEDVDRPQPQPVRRAPLDLAANARYRATGKRKTSVARVTIKPGTGAWTVNGRPLETALPRMTLQKTVRQPLETAGYDERMDVVARVGGGGVSAQASALRHGVARALVEADPALRPELKRRGFLTRDSRAKERRKAGLKKARKRPQFSKR
jgi:small subunit ribosomal protein S9